MSSHDEPPSYTEVVSASNNQRVSSPVTQPSSHTDEGLPSYHDIFGGRTSQATAISISTTAADPTDDSHAPDATVNVTSETSDTQSPVGCCAKLSCPRPSCPRPSCSKPSCPQLSCPRLSSSRCCCQEKHCKALILTIGILIAAAITIGMFFGGLGTGMCRGGYLLKQLMSFTSYIAGIALLCGIVWAVTLCRGKMNPSMFKHGVGFFSLVLSVMILAGIGETYVVWTYKPCNPFYKSCDLLMLSAYCDIILMKSSVIIYSFLLCLCLPGWIYILIVILRQMCEKFC